MAVASSRDHKVEINHNLKTKFRQFGFYFSKQYKRLIRPIKTPIAICGLKEVSQVGGSVLSLFILSK
jgi:hypothetical protein